MTDVPASVLETEAAVRIGLAVRRCAYRLDVVPRPNGVDFGAERQGTIWATIHVDLDARRPLGLKIGATVFGGARQDAPGPFPYHEPAAYEDGRLDRFVRERLGQACRRGLEEDPAHCRGCPDEARHRAGDFSP